MEPSIPDTTHFLQSALFPGMQGHSPATPQLFVLSSQPTSANSVKVLGSVFYIKSWEDLQLDKSHISGPAWYVSYCVIAKELNYLPPEFRNVAAVQTHIYYLSNAILAHVTDHAALSRTLCGLRLLLLRSPFEHSAGSDFSRCLTSCALGALSWELVLFHSERQLCPWSTVKGAGIKGKVATFYCFPDVFLSTSHPPCAHHSVECQKTCCAQWGEGEKPCSKARVCILYISPQRVSLGFVLLVWNIPFLKSQQLKYKSLLHRSIQGR